MCIIQNTHHSKHQYSSIIHNSPFSNINIYMQKCTSFLSPTCMWYQFSSPNLYVIVMLLSIHSPISPISPNFLTMIWCMREESPLQYIKINHHPWYIVQTYIYLANVNTIIQYLSHQYSTSLHNTYTSPNINTTIDNI